MPESSEEFISRILVARCLVWEARYEKLRATCRKVEAAAWNSAPLLAILESISREIDSIDAEIRAERGLTK